MHVSRGLAGMAAKPDSSSMVDICAEFLAVRPSGVASCVHTLSLSFPSLSLSFTRAELSSSCGQNSCKVVKMGSGRRCRRPDGVQLFPVESFTSRPDAERTPATLLSERRASLRRGWWPRVRVCACLYVHDVESRSRSGSFTRC